MSCLHRSTVPNKAVELTAKSVRSYLAPAFGSSSPRALGVYLHIQERQWKSLCKRVFGQYGNRRTRQRQPLTV